MKWNPRRRSRHEKCPKHQGEALLQGWGYMFQISYHPSPFYGLSFSQTQPRALLLSIWFQWKGKLDTEKCFLDCLCPLHGYISWMQGKWLTRRGSCLCSRIHLPDKKSNTNMDFTSVGRSFSLSEPSFPCCYLGTWILMHRFILDINWCVESTVFRVGQRVSRSQVWDLSFDYPFPILWLADSEVVLLSSNSQKMMPWIG